MTTPQGGWCCLERWGGILAFSPTWTIWNGFPTRGFRLLEGTVKRGHMSSETVSVYHGPLWWGHDMSSIFENSCPIPPPHHKYTHACVHEHVHTHTTHLQIASFLSFLVSNPTNMFIFGGSFFEALPPGHQSVAILQFVNIGLCTLHYCPDVVQLGPISMEISPSSELFCDFHLWWKSEFSHWVHSVDLDWVLQTRRLWILSFKRCALCRINICLSDSVSNILIQLIPNKNLNFHKTLRVECLFLGLFLVLGT